jgi:5-formyltetrahydrofolate cyclo-ligase
MDKNELRKQLVKKRKLLSKEYVEQHSKCILTNLLDFINSLNAYNILCYASFCNEVDTMALMNELLIMGKRVSLPKTMNEHIMEPFRIENTLSQLVTGRFGIKEPNETMCDKINPGDVDVIVVPGVAFDKTGNRLGFGYGYYDRFLKTTREDCVKIALAYQFQILDCIPVTQTDVKVDYIITDEGIIKCCKS